MQKKKVCNQTKKFLKYGIMIMNMIAIVSLTACSSKKQGVEEKGLEVLQVEQKKTEDEKNIEITMEEAIEIGSQEAKKYYENLKLTEVHSYDNDTEPKITAGENGKREFWYVNFANEKSNYVSVLIQAGQIVAVEKFDKNVNNGLLDLKTIKLTSFDAVKCAKKIGLQGGNPNNEEEWVSGYNFKMSFGTLIDSPEEERVFLEVIGISPNGNFAHVDIDAVTGEVILAEEKIEYANGEVEWKTFEME